MRFIHTSDWHLGKSLKGQSLLDDQAHVLDELLRLIDDQKAEAVVIAGDIYDRSVPPSEAVELFDEIVLKLVERRLPILAIAGNHDGARRLNFGTKLFERSEFFMRSLLRADAEPIILNDRFGEIYFSLLPYFEPSGVRDIFGVSENISFDEAGALFIENARSKLPRGVRSVAIAHAFITGGARSDSETQSVGGADNVNAAHFDGYDYVALGHLHKPQRMGADSIRYSGSPLKYSFDEWTHRKGALSVELDQNGRASIEFLSLTPKHDLVVIEDTIENILKREPSKDYVAVRLTDKTPVLNARAKLEPKFPNVLSLEKIGIVRDRTELRRLEGISLLEQFEDFFYYQTEEKLTEEERSAFEECLKEVEGGGD